MKGVCRLCGLLLLLLLPGMAPAQSGSAGMFDARVVVESDSARERADAARDGLARVISRLTGDDGVGEREAVREILDDAESYLQQFAYGDADDDQGGAQRMIHLQFDGPAVERALIEHRVPLWSPADRPRTLVWLAVDRGDGRRLVSGDSGGSEVPALRSAARRQGLTILFPLLDLEDQRAMRMSDLWGGFREPIMAASERYRTGAVLAGRLTQQGGNWRGRWLLFRDDESVEFTVSGDSAEDVVTGGVRGVMRETARRVATVPDAGTGTTVLVRIRGINSLDAFARTQDTLSEVRGVLDAAPYRATGDFTDFHVRIQADGSRLVRALENSGRFSLDPREPVGDGEEGSDGEDGAPARERTPDYTFRVR